MFEKYLQEIGLNEKEAAIYLSLLQVDNDSVAEVAKKTKIKRPTAYFILDGLKKKGLVSEVQVGKIVHFAAEPPERLETFVERQKTVFEERAARLKDIIPQIKSVQREQGERPIIKFFEGRDGAISALEEFYGGFQEGESKGYFIYNRDLLEEVFTPAEREKFFNIRSKKKIHPIAVYTRQVGDMKFETPGTRTRLNEKKYPLSADITVLEDKIIATTLGGQITSTLIQSKDLAQTLSSLVQYINDMEKGKGGE